MTRTAALSWAVAAATTALLAGGLALGQNLSNLHNGLIAASFSAVVQGVTQVRPAIVYSSASADAGLLNHAGIPCISYGPGSVRLAHTDDDVVSLRQVAEASQVLASWIGT